MQLVRNIGRGGFGTVDEVCDAAGGRYAQKTFSVFQAGNYSAELIENVKQRFVREARIQADLNHPNIMPVLAVNLSVDPPSFLMPVAAASLADDITLDRRLRGSALRAIMDILAGLEEIHSVGIYHRDLKPQNVMRLPNAQGDERYVIGDFGLMSIKDTQLTVLTQTGMQMRSDLYTAPEIVSDLRRASVFSDIYSVGCILHDMYGEGADRLPCAEVNDDRGPFAEIIAICTRRDPRRRFSSAAALRDAILSVDLTGAVASEQQVSDFIRLLTGDDPISAQTWEQIHRKLRQIFPSADAHLILHQIPVARIAEVVGTNVDAAIGICRIFCEWAKTTAFDFNLCDGIAIRLEEFLPLDDITCSVEVRLALLELGTSHNRWYVERIFARLCGPSMENNTARRLAMELRAMDGTVCSKIAHLERSINFDRANLHPFVVTTLSQVCG